MDSNTTGFDPQRAFQYASLIARPRRVETSQEKIVGQQIASWMEGFGFQVESQDFQFSNALPVFITAEILIGQFLILVTIGLQAFACPVKIGGAFCLIALIALTGPINRWVQLNSLEPIHGEPVSPCSSLCRRLGKRYAAVNYFAKLSDAPLQSNGTQLLLTAHYDSKSQRMPLPIRITLFVLAIGASLLFAAWVIAAYFIPLLAGFGITFGVVSLLAGIPLLFLDMGNASPGAIDNASGVGLVLSIAEWLAYKQDSHPPPGLSFLFTSAEEFGALGANAFVRQHNKLLNRQNKNGRLFVLNIDGIGVDGSLYWVGKPIRQAQPDAPDLTAMVRQACHSLGFPLKPFALPGALYDHMPFSDQGYDAGTLIAISKESLVVHTSRDSIDQLDIQGFKRSGQLVLKMIKMILG